MGSGVIASARRKVCNAVTAYNSTIAELTSNDACNNNTYNVTRYHDGSGSRPVNGDVVYSDSRGCNVFVGLDLWYSDDGGLFSYQISNSGVVSNYTAC